MNPRLARLVAATALVAISGGPSTIFAGTASADPVTLPDLHFAPESDIDAVWWFIHAADNRARQEWNAEMSRAWLEYQSEREKQRTMMQAACQCGAEVLPHDFPIWPYL